jgi:hypothetical protein
MKPKSGEPSWRWRRIAIYAVTAWGCYQLFLLIDAADSRLNETIAWGWQVLIMALVLGYTGFATAQDVAAIWTTRTAKPYAEPPQEPTPAPVDTVVVVEEKRE